MDSRLDADVPESEKKGATRSFPTVHHNIEAFLPVPPLILIRARSR
jgi:hypothetical protein